IPREVRLQVLENKALSWGIRGKSAPILAEVTIRKSKSLHPYHSTARISSSTKRDRSGSPHPLIHKTYLCILNYHSASIHVFSENRIKPCRNSATGSSWIVWFFP